MQRPRKRAADDHRRARFSGRGGVAAPEGLPRTEGSFIRVSLSAFGGAHPSWATPVEAYFRLLDGQWKLIGFERLPESAE